LSANWLFGAGALLALAGAAHGQGSAFSAYPTQPIRIVTSDIGGGNDLMARQIAAAIAGPLGQPVMVDNRAAGLVPGEIVSKAPPDGHTLLMVSTSHTTNPTLVRKLPFDTLRDLAPVILLAQSVTRDWDKKYDFATVKTFSIKIGTSWGNQLSENRVLNDLSEAIVERGWKKVESESAANVVVVVHGATQQKQTLNTFYALSWIGLPDIWLGDLTRRGPFCFCHGYKRYRDFSKLLPLGPRIDLVVRADDASDALAEVFGRPYSKKPAWPKDTVEGRGVRPH
jgi:hypothetical protein